MSENKNRHRFGSKVIVDDAYLDTINSIERQVDAKAWNTDYKSSYYGEETETSSEGGGEGVNVTASSSGISSYMRRVQKINGRINSIFAMLTVIILTVMFFFSFGLFRAASAGMKPEAYMDSIMTNMETLYRGKGDILPERDVIWDSACFMNNVNNAMDGFFDWTHGWISNMKSISTDTSNEMQLSMTAGLGETRRRVVGNAMHVVDKLKTLEENAYGEVVLLLDGINDGDGNRN